MDIEAFKKLYSAAQPFIGVYHEKQILVQAQLMYKNSTECSTEEAVLIATWMTTNTQWLIDNEAYYNKCLAMAALPKADIAQLYEAYDALYGGHEGDGDSNVR